MFIFAFRGTYLCQAKTVGRMHEILRLWHSGSGFCFSEGIVEVAKYIGGPIAFGGGS